MPRQERADETRTRILDVAAELFARSGYDATGVAEVCSQAGVSKGAFYHHFSGKHELFIQLLYRWQADLNAQLEEIRRQEASFQDRLVGMAGLIEPILGMANGRLPLFLEFWSHACRDPSIREATLAPYEHYHNFFVELVRSDVDAGVLRDVDPNVVGYILLSLSLGVILQGLLEPTGVDWKGVAQEAMRILSRGIQNNSSCPSGG